MQTEVDEERPLLNGRSSPKTNGSRWRKRLQVDVDRRRADFVLLLCYLITGLLDSAAITVWGSFVSMQTGNTVYIGLGLAAPADSNRWIKSGTSLCAFSIGSFLFSRFHRLAAPSPKRRWVLCASFALQTALVFSAAAITTWGPRRGSGARGDEISWDVLVPIALLALQSCGQAVASRALRYNALTSVVLTSIYCDLFSDAELFALQNVERNRRVGAPVLLLVGAIGGGVFARSSFGIAGALWMATALKLATAMAWYFWPAELQSNIGEE